VFVRVLDAPPCVRMFSPVLEDVEADDRLLGRLNEPNAEIRFARFFVVEGRVIVAAEMFVAPFVAEHVTRACLEVGSLADEIGGTLQKEFGGEGRSRKRRKSRRCSSDVAHHDTRLSFRRPEPEFHGS